MPKSFTIYLRIIFSLLLFSVLNHSAIAGDSALNVSSKTIFRFFERENEVRKKFNAIPVYEFLEVDYGDPQLGGFSFHADGWKRADMGDREYYDNDIEGYILSGYVQYYNSANGLDIKLGRQSIYAGIINNSVDGLGVKGYAGSHVSMLVFGGLSVGYEDDNGRTGDWTFGGRVGFQRFFPGEIGLSYMGINDDSEKVANKLGIDISGFFFERISFTGLSFWNLETQNWGEHSYSTDVYINQYSLNLRYQMFQYGDYFSDTKTDPPFRYLQDSDETLTVIGCDLIWQKFHHFDTGLKMNYYTYDIRRENSQYVAVVFNFYGEQKTVIGAEIGTMVGDSSESNYYLGRTFFFWEAPAVFLNKWFVDGEIMYVDYNTAIFEKDNSLFVSVGCGRRIIDDKLRLKFSADYSMDPYYETDIQLMTVAELEY